MELVSPAGNIEKLKYAWEYGADSAYIGLKKFSLRIKADNFYENEHKEIIKIKNEYKKQGKEKKLLCALNISFHNSDIENFLREIDYFKQYPIDAFIIQDLGILPILQKEFPNTALHLSTQANCINKEAAKIYYDLGFKRVVVGREASLKDIAEIKQRIPELELECFVHGAMCIAYSGRCLMSAYLTGRSANSGFCSHSCRWDWRLLANELKTGEREFLVEEFARPGDFFPVIEGEDFTALFSSKDLCMIDHLQDFKNAGVDALKIEGRMKSIYYTALVTRAYRKKIDEITGKITSENAKPFIDELYNVAHRKFSTGFYFSPEEANITTKGESYSPWELAGTIGNCVNNFMENKGEKNAYRDWEFNSMNKITSKTDLQFLGPNSLPIDDKDYILINPETGEERDWVCHGHPCLIRTNKPIEKGFLVRFPNTKKPKTNIDRRPKKGVN